jgi:POT family proton-dependent oligopeptide transporter
MSKNANHPKGLYVLFFTEMWERFGYYLMLGIFSLYMLDSAENGGMGFSAAKKSDIYGTYLGLVYLTPFLGGLLADRILGYRNSILIGGLLMAGGYFGLSFTGNESIFYVSLLLIILGNGFFKPNISTLVGNLYNDEKYKQNKDAGYNIFYMGINIGSFICNFVAAYLRINYGWGWAFAAAGIGMLLGLAIFMAGTKHIKHADVIKPANPEDMSLSKIFLIVLLPVFLVGIIGWFIPGNILGSDANDAFVFGCLPVIVFYYSLYKRANSEDRKPILALLSIFASVIVFWAVFHQNGDALTVWAEYYTDREQPKVIQPVFDYLKLTEEKTVEHYNSVKNFNDITFKSNDSILSIRATEYYKANNIKAGDSIMNIRKKLDNNYHYFNNLPPHQIPTESKSLKLISTELFQSVNPFWVILLTPIVVGLFGFLKSKKKEPSTPTKIALGLLITGLSTLVMVGAVSATQMESEKASAWWLIASYGVITVGELFLSPMGLSLVSKLSPPRITALMMGGWFLSTAVGNKLSGMISGLWESVDNKANFFLLNFILCLAAFFILFSMLKWLKKVMQEKNIH